MKNIYWSIGSIIANSMAIGTWLQHIVRGTEVVFGIGVLIFCSFAIYMGIDRIKKEIKKYENKNDS